jgi:hypothetical protein
MSSRVAANAAIAKIRVIIISSLVQPRKALVLSVGWGGSNEAISHAAQIERGI